MIFYYSIKLNIMKTLKNIDVRSQNYFYDEFLKLIAFYKYIYFI